MTRANSFGFRRMSSRNDVSIGEISPLIFCSAGVVSADCRFENTDPTFESSSPVFSIASTVLAKLGVLGLLAIASTSFRFRRIASL